MIDSAPAGNGIHDTCPSSWPNLMGPGGCSCIMGGDHDLHRCLHGEIWSTRSDIVPARMEIPMNRLQRLQHWLFGPKTSTERPRVTLGEVLAAQDDRHEW